MPKRMPMPERRLSDSELSQSVAALARRFVQRWDLYAKQLEDGRYIMVPEPLSVVELYAHLRGELTLGTYLLDQQSQARFIVIDADEVQGFNNLINAAASLAKESIPTYLETSRRGGHLWFFFDKPISGGAAREFGQGILAAYSLTGMEIYPKQAHLKTGPGSLIRLPFGVHQASKRRYGFITPEGEPLAATLREQLKQVSFAKTVPMAALGRYQGLVPPIPLSTDFEPSQAVSDQVSQQLKAAIPVADFVGRYVTLKPTGSGYVGLCPFHEDTHPSFGINAEGNYWHCFAGCGGGSIIDFWMKWRGVDFITALSELSQLLL